MRNIEQWSDIPTDSKSEAYQELREQLFFYGKQAVMDAPQLYVNVDVEADGVPGYGSLLSVGACSPYGENFYVELKPSSKQFVLSQREFCESHGLKRERLMHEGVDPSVALKRFMAWTSKLQDAYEIEPVFTAFNAWFDYGFIALACAQDNVANLYGIAPFDLKSYVPGVTGDLDWKATAKSKLPAIIQPEGDFTHHALEDAQYQQELHYGLVGLSSIAQSERSKL